jgi:hypothetical protein
VGCSPNDWDFVDYESPAKRAQLARLRKIGLARQRPPRYRWHINTDGKVDSCELDEHVAWVVSKIRPKSVLSDLKVLGYGYWLQFYWEGGGTGGGPRVTPTVARELAKHDVELRIGFYAVNPE